MDESVLVKNILAHDRHALHEFYHVYTPKLRNFIRRKINNDNDGEEILQDTLFSFLEALRDFHGQSKVSTFLFSICQHKIVDFYRKKKIKHIVFSQMPQLEGLVSPLLNPEEELDATMLTEELRRAFGNILPQYKIILQMKYIEEKSVSDIAQKFACTFKSAESLLFRARKAFVRAYSHS